MNVLFFEDKGTVSYYTKDALEKEGYKIFDAGSINEANSYFKEESIDALLIDLNMNPEGLTEEQKMETEGGLFTGWIWVKNYVYPSRPDLRKKTIILSEYIHEFKERKSSDPDYPGDHCLLPKRSMEDPMARLLALLREFDKIAGHSSNSPG
jgi:hypothetical protein